MMKESVRFHGLHTLLVIGGSDERCSCQWWSFITALTGMGTVEVHRVIDNAAAL
jgi:hypothetical protein